SCPNGWLTYEGSRSCYRLGGTSKKWIEARKACFAMGGDLVKIDSAQENNYVALLALAIPKNNNYLWIGLVADKNHKFMWIDGTYLSGQYSNWRSGEPNNDGGVENCGHLYLDSMTWNDDTCVQKSPPLSYICEKEKPKHFN
ncbi:perlucin-like protein, partial [Actinia tenebrosa]|uniref:Perlucin-like protein n=1 Tax=Actinia tenebrosa TaxID=6105 RepID=A0A6P8HN21_ACTTE